MVLLQFPPLIISAITMFAFVMLRMTWVCIYYPTQWVTVEAGPSCPVQCFNTLAKCYFLLVEDKAALSVKQIAPLEGGTLLLQSGVCKGLPFLARAKHI